MHPVRGEHRSLGTVLMVDDQRKKEPAAKWLELRALRFIIVRNIQVMKTVETCWHRPSACMLVISETCDTAVYTTHAASPGTRFPNH